MIRGPDRNRIWAPLCVLALGLGLALASLHLSQVTAVPGGVLFSLGALALLADGLAVALPGGALFSLAPAPLAVLALGGGGGLTWLVAAAGLLLRLALKPDSWPHLCWQFCARAGWLCLLLWLQSKAAVAALIPALLWWLLVERSWPDRAARRPQEWILPYQVASACAVPLFEMAAHQNPGYLWLALPALGSASRAVEAELLRLKVEGERQLAEDLRSQQDRLGHTRLRLEETQHRLQTQRRSQTVFWELAQRLFLCQTLEQLCQETLQYLAARLHFEGAALVVEGVPNPLNLPAICPLQQPGERVLLQGHPHTWIIPLASGYLYCGRLAQQGPFADEERELLATLGGLLALAVRAVEVQRLQREQLGEWLESAKTAAVGQLSAGLAHELNSPLAAIGLQLDLAQRRLSRPQELQAALTAMRAPLDRAQQLIARLLYYSRDGSLESQVDLNSVVTDSVAFLKGAFEAEGIHWEVELGSLRPLRGQAAELQQLLIHLLENARQAMQGRGGKLTVRTFTHQDKQILLVADEGSGLPPEVLPRIFEPFFTTRQAGQGVGLGLTVAWKIASRHGGRLYARNRSDGPGAEFVLEV